MYTDRNMKIISLNSIFNVLAINLSWGEKSKQKMFSRPAVTRCLIVNIIQFIKIIEKELFLNLFPVLNNTVIVCIVRNKEKDLCHYV